MVGYYKAYFGSTQTPLIYAIGKMGKKVYKGSNLIYQIGFSPVTFSPSSSIQSFDIPPGVSKIHVDCVASKGFTPHSSAQGGNGGRVQCDLVVNSGDTLYISVGDVPSNSNVTYNASDIRVGGTELSNRIIVAGGGGSGSYVTSPFTRYASGGAGGGTTGGNGGTSGGSGSTIGGAGGTQSAGGLGAYGVDAYDPNRSPSGTLGYGGATGTGGNVDAGGNSGAGGAGYYGGGGSRRSAVFYGSSQRDSWARGAGGGSSYTNASCSNVVHTQGYRNGAGYVTISFVE